MKKVILIISVFTIFCLSLKAEETLQEYAARYKFPQGSAINEVNVVFENGALTLSSSLGTAAIEKTSDDHFNIPNYKGTAVFVRNAAKKITGIKIEIKGVSFSGNREEKDTLTVMPVPISSSTFPIKYLPPMLTGEDYQ
ncbi:hypothetical protein [Ferruginibacter sp.]|nr:hypothetical protein [Ferruginibacter sp.]